MKSDIVRAALLATGIKPTTSRLLTYMADVADERGLFYERRARTAHRLGAHADTIKAGLSELRELGYITEVRAARAGRNTRMLRLHPGAWPQPSLSSDDGAPTPEQLELDGGAVDRSVLVEQLRNDLTRARSSTRAGAVTESRAPPHPTPLPSHTD